jgi:hypothetical protein
MDSVPVSIYHHRTVAPCRDCSDRFIGCHSTCKKYADWSNDDKTKSDEARRKHDAENMKKDYAIQGHIKRKKGVRK